MRRAVIVLILKLGTSLAPAIVQLAVFDCAFKNILASMTGNACMSGFHAPLLH